MAIMATVAVIMFWISFANTRERIKAPATHNIMLAGTAGIYYETTNGGLLKPRLVLTNIGFGVIRHRRNDVFRTAYYLGSAGYFMDAQGIFSGKPQAARWPNVPDAERQQSADV